MGTSDDKWQETKQRRVERRKALVRALHQANILDPNEEPAEVFLEGELPLIHALGKRGLLNEQQATKQLAKHYGLEFHDLASIDLNFEKSVLPFLEHISLSHLREHAAIPVKWSKNEVILAMANPVDFELVQLVQFTISHSVKLVVAEGGEIAELHEMFNQAQQEAQKEEDDFDEYADVDTVASKIKDLPATPSSASKPKVTKAVVNVVSKAVKKGASEIHLNPKEDGLKVAVMVDGKLTQMPDISPHLKNNFIARCKMLGSMPISTPDRPLEGTGRVKLGEEKFDLNIKTTPTLYGDKIVMRIPQAVNKIEAAEQRAVPQLVLDELHSLLRAPAGIILVGEGMQSSQLDIVYSCMNYMGSQAQRFITTERTLKYSMSNIERRPMFAMDAQQIRDEFNVILDLKPDVLFIDQIYNPVVIEGACKASENGCKVIIAMRQGDAISMLDNILSLGIDREFFSNHLLGIFSHCSVHEICSSCEQKEDMTEAQSSLFRLCNLSVSQLNHGAGCKECAHTGYLAERELRSLLSMDSVLRACIAEGKNAHQIIAVAREQCGFESMNHKACNLLVRGEISFEEAYSFLLGRALNEMH